MTHKFNINPNIRTIYVSEAGVDSDAGTNLETSKKTVAVSMTTADALTPVTGDPVAIADPGASTYAEDVVVSDNVFMDMINCRMVGAGGSGTTVTGGANATAAYLTIQTNGGSGGVAFSTGGKSRMGLVTPSIILNGTNQTAILINGSSNQIFLDISQILSQGIDNTLVSHVSSEAQSSFTFNEWNSTENGLTGLSFNSTSSDAAEYRGGAIRLTGTGTTGIHGINGNMAAYVNIIEAEDAIIVESGMIVSIFDADVVGKITINAGGTLNCTINSHDGELINNGTLIGRIGNKFYRSPFIIEGDLDVNGAISATSIEAAGADTQLQFNNAGTLDGIPGITTDGTNLLLADNVNLDFGGGEFVLSYDGFDATFLQNVGDIDFTLGTASDINFNLGTNDQNSVFSIKDSLSLILFTLAGHGRIGVGGNPDASALLDLTSASFGFLMPRMTTAEKLNIPSPATGLEVYDITLNQPEYFDGSVWLATTGSDVSSVTGGDNINISGSAQNPVVNLDDAIKFIDGSTQDTGSTPDGIGWHPSMISASLQSTTLANEDTAPLAIFVRADGRKLYMTGNVSEDIFEYDMSVPWDLSTLSFLDTKLLFIGAPRGLFFKPDGTKCYVCRFTAQIAEFTMSTPWDVTSITATGFFSASGGIQAMSFKADGTSFYLLDGNNNIVKQYDMAVPWDMDTATDPSISFDFSNEFTGGGALTFRPDGRSMYAGNGTVIFEYELTTPWDITTAILIDSGTVVNGEFLFSPDGTKAIGLDRGTDLVHRFDIGISTSIAKVGISDAEVYRFLDGSEQTEAATENNSAGHFELNKEIGELPITLGAPLIGFFVSENGMTMFAAGNEPTIHRYDMTSPWDISTASDSGNSGVFLQSVKSIFVDPDGTIVITMASDGNFRTWELATPFDLSTNTQIAGITLTDSTSTSSFWCSKNGRQIYLLDSTAGLIRQYEMGSAYDVSTLVNTGQTLATGSTSTVQSLWLRDDGRRVYNRFAAQMRESVLTVPWDLSTAVLRSQIEIDQNDSLIRQFCIKNDGSVMFTGSTDPFDRIVQYNLGLVTSAIKVDGEVTIGDNLQVDGEATIGGERASRIAPQTIEIFTASQLDDLATAGVITVSTQTAFILKANVTTSNRFDIESGIRFTIGAGGQGYSLTYDGADTFITSVDSIVVIETSLTATGGGTLFDITGQIGTIINIDFTLFSGWKMGAISRTPGAEFGPDVFLLHMSALNWQDTLTLENVSVLTIDEVAFIPFAGAGVPFVEIKGDTPGSYTVNLVSGSLAAGESLMRIDPGISSDSKVLVSGSTVTGTLFDTTGGTTGTFTVVGDAFEVVPISSVIDSVSNPGTARFIVAGGSPVVFVGQELILGDSTEPSYDGTHIISETGVGFIELEGVPFNGDAEGTFESESIEVTATAHGLSELDTLKLIADLSTDYGDGGFTIYNVLTNTFQVNAVFTGTASGTWDTAGIDQTDPRVLAFQNPGFVDSKYIASSQVNNNTFDIAGASITNNTFRDMLFGEAGNALVIGSTMERFKLTNELTGEHTYIGNEPYDNSLPWHFFSSSSGGTVKFRYKWLIDPDGGGFVDFTDVREMVVEIGSTGGGIGGSQPMLLKKGDKIKPNFTRNSGSSDFLTEYAQIG